MKYKWREERRLAFLDYNRYVFKIKGGMTSKDSQWRMVCSLITESESFSSLATSSSYCEETEKENHLWFVISHRDFTNQIRNFQIQIWNFQICSCPWVRRLSKLCFLFSLLVGHAVLGETPPPQVRSPWCRKILLDLLYYILSFQFRDSL